ETARCATGGRVPRLSRALHRGPGAPRARETRQDPRRTGFPVPIAQTGRPAVGYFPACPRRLFGTPGTEHDLLSGPDAVVTRMERAGDDVIIPDKLTGQCCGQPFLSKGFPEAAAKVGSSLSRELSALSDAGRLTVVTDASTCARHLQD